MKSATRLQAASAAASCPRKASSDGAPGLGIVGECHQLSAFAIDPQTGAVLITDANGNVLGAAGASAQPCVKVMPGALPSASKSKKPRNKKKP